MGKKKNITAIALSAALAGAFAGSALTYLKVKPRRLVPVGSALEATLSQTTPLTPEAPDNEGLVALATFINAQYELRGQRDEEVEAAFARRDRSGQHPAILREGCSDSYLPDFFDAAGLRFTPGLVFLGANPGNALFTPSYDNGRLTRTPNPEVAYFMAHFAGEGRNDTNHGHPSKYHEVITMGHTNCGAMAALWSDTNGRRSIDAEPAGLRNHLQLLRGQERISALLRTLRDQRVSDRYANARLAEANVDDQVSLLIERYPGFVRHGGMILGVMVDMDHSYRSAAVAGRGNHVIVNVNGNTDPAAIKDTLRHTLTGVPSEALDYMIHRLPAE